MPAITRKYQRPGNKSTSRARTFQLNSSSGLELHNVTAKRVTYRGRPAVRLIESAEPAGDGSAIAILADSNFKDGLIETDLAGVTRPDAPPDARGFVGIAFRVQAGGSRFECFFFAADQWARGRPASPQSFNPVHFAARLSLGAFAAGDARCL